MVLRLPNNIIIVSKTYPSFLILKEGSTFLTKPLFPLEREDVTALSSVFAPPVPPQREGPYRKHPTPYGNTTQSPVFTGDTEYFKKLDFSDF